MSVSEGAIRVGSSQNPGCIACAAHDGRQLFAGTHWGNEAADIGSKVAYGMMAGIANIPFNAIDAAKVSAAHN
jgi:hypothetical protein